MLPALLCQEQQALDKSHHSFWPRGGYLTWVQTHEFAAFLRVLAVLLTPLGPLTQGSNTHLRLPSMAGTAQAWVISLGSEVEPFIHHIIFDINTRLTSFTQKRRLLRAALGVPAVEVMVPQGRKVETLELGAEHVVILRHGRGEDGIWGQEHFWGAFECHFPATF